MEQTDSERQAQIEKARSAACRLLEQDKPERAHISEEHRERLRRLREESQKKDDKDHEKLESMLETVLKSGGLWQAEDIDEAISSRSKTESKKLLTVQINIHTKILKTEISDKIAASRASIDQLRAHHLALIAKGVPEDHCDLVEMLVDPASIADHDFAQKWAQSEGSPAEWCAGTILRYIADTHDYELFYHTDQSVCYLQVDELLTDMIMGNLDIQY